MHFFQACKCTFFKRINAFCTGNLNVDTPKLYGDSAVPFRGSRKVQSLHKEEIVNNKDYVSDTGNLSLIYDYDKEAGFLVKVYLKTYDIEENDRFDLHVDIDADGGIQSKMDLMFYDGVKNVEGNMYIYASSISSIWICAIEFTIKDSYTLGSSEYTVRGETNEYPNALSSSTAYKLLNSMLKLGISSFSDFCRENALSVEVFFPNVA